ncbi:MAG: metallophosphoesterase [Kofleriaceae bacterium]
MVVPPRTNEIEIRVRGLDPRHDGLRIAQLSDIHVGHMTPVEHVRAAVAAANAAKPDLVAMTGDYVNWRRHEAGLAGEQLAGLRAHRVLAVMGNHDYFTWGAGVHEALAKKNHYDVLRNEHTVIDIKGAPLAVIGVDDPVTRHDDLDRAFHGVPEIPRVVLCHAPDLGPTIARRGADLILSGHTHGGQIYVKGITERIMKKVGLHFRRGTFALDERASLYVTPGVGFSGIRRRVGEGTAAEVAVLTLRPM